MDWASLAWAPIHTHVVLITGAYADRQTHTQTSGLSMSYLQGGHCRRHPEDIKKRKTEEEKDMVKARGDRGTMQKNHSHINK